MRTVTINDTYIKGDPSSENSIKELLEIQAEQLAEWEMLLKPTIFEILKQWVDSENRNLANLMDRGDKFYIIDQVTRGDSLAGFVRTIPNQIRFD